MTEPCEHGRVRRAGIGRESGKPYAGMFCVEKVCAVEWLPVGEVKPDQRSYDAAVEAAREVCRQVIAAARAARDEVIAEAAVTFGIDAEALPVGTNVPVAEVLPVVTIVTVADDDVPPF